MRGSERPSLVGGAREEEERDAGGGKMNFSGSELKLWAVLNDLHT